MTPTIHLGIDVGGTASRWVASSASGEVLARGQSGGATGHVFNPAEKLRLEAALRDIAAQTSALDLTIASVTAGLTGYGAAVADVLQPILAATFSLPTHDVILLDDMTLAYAAIFAPGAGHLISAGTGSIGVHIGTGETYVRVGGRGILIDDAGSGSWIALRALDTLYRRLDHTGSYSGMKALADAVFGKIGSDSWHGVREFVYAGDRGRIGTLATAVGDAAQQGDATALTILRDAGKELAQLGLALTARAGKQPIGFVGGVLNLHPAVGNAITTALADAKVVFPTADAALLAAHLQGETQPLWRDRLSNFKA